MITRRRLFKSGLMLGAVSITGTISMSSPAAGRSPTATAVGYRQPIEAELHERTFMQWPARPDIYGGKHAIDTVRSSIAGIANAIARFEPVVMLARPEHVAAARKMLSAASIELWPVEVDDLWCRDTGPTFVRSPSGDLAVSELNFNGWGGKQGHGDDRRIARRVGEKLGLPIFNNGLIGEGGGVEVDGAGLLLAHESSWVNSNRNRQGKPEIERLLLDALGGQQLIWAPGIKGADITDYHIDALARFVTPGQVLIQLPKRIDRQDPWSIAAFETYDILKLARDAQGRKLDIVVMPEPNPNRIRSRSKNFVSSYVNSLVSG
jgi:agmatine deiminase